ncbi:MAG: Gmad2 immunoglobulin-like domain-containing protein [Patescibacteria group bacterium]|nr:MAG: Gmad2 immunoglobulin-like domain-containing protein [Patescibacteria group bacterium]
MKTHLLVPALLVLLGGGCLSPAPAPQPPANEQPAPAPDPQPAPVAEDPVYGPTAKANLIVVDSPLIGGLVSSPLVITGRARGPWYFEASFPVELLNASNVVIASGIAQAQTDWMTTEFVPFTATLTFASQNLAGTSGTLVFHKDNPSGEPQFDDQMNLPVNF